MIHPSNVLTSVGYTQYVHVVQLTNSASVQYNMYDNNKTHIPGLRGVKQLIKTLNQVI